MSSSRNLTLSNGAKLPAVGLGLWKIPNESTAEIVYEAIKLGYRHFDSACDYGNEIEAGIGFQRAFQEGLCQREDLWITSKLWNTHHRSSHVEAAFAKTLSDLQLDYLDLYLVHFPIALKHVSIEERYPPGWFFDPAVDSPKMEIDSVPISETWSAMESLARSGRAKQIGVCNFGCSLLRDLLSYAEIKPTVLQVESHPYLTQDKLLRFCNEHSIAYTAFSPLGAGSYIELGMAQSNDSVLNEACIHEMAQAKGKTEAQIVLRWGIQRGTSVIPKSSRIDRLRENIDIFDFELSSEEMTQISSLDRNRRFNDPGVFCESAFGCFFPIYE
ncbi:MAG: aldo/keto reductase [Aureliella sp.]